jgi:hypothetical protein
VLLLAISVCVASIIDFGYNAYQRTSFFTSYTDPLTKQPRSGYHDEYAGAIETDLNLHMQLDAAVALLASAAVLGISVELSKLSRRRKRLVFGAEAVVLTLMIVVVSIVVRTP